MDHLCAISSEFKRADLTAMAKNGSVLISCELLRVAGESEESQKSRVSLSQQGQELSSPYAYSEGGQLHQVMQLLATITNRKSGPTKPASRASNLLAGFFEINVLGIVSQLSDVVNDPRGRFSTFERKRNLRGMNEMIRLARHNISVALPQIGACFQSALETSELRDVAFTSWVTMITNLDKEDLQSMIEQTFSVIIQNWEVLASDSKEAAFGMLQKLFNGQESFIQINIDNIPSLETVPRLSKFESHLEIFRTQNDVRRQFSSLTRRCTHENLSVVQQALTELLPYLRSNQSFIHLSAVSEQPDPVVPALVRALLDTCVRFAGKSPEVASLCAQCLGLIGCLDPNRFEAVREERDTLLVNNFGNADETIDWVVFFIQEVLVKAFMSATNPTSQGFLAFAMQELLRFCEFDSTVSSRALRSQTGTNHRRWSALPDVTRNVLTPFLNSRYSVTANLVKTEYSHPIFSLKQSHSTWLRALVLSLLDKGQGENAKMIFQVCSRVIRIQDTSIPSFLLPFVALNIIVDDDDEHTDLVGSELLEVLRFPMEGCSNVERENLRLSSETVFRVLDYLSRWLKEKRRQYSSLHPTTSKHAAKVAAAGQNGSVESDQIKKVEKVISMIPAEVISQRAVDCKAFSRALFHWEQYIRQRRESKLQTEDQQAIEPLFEHLQEIYTQIDEPDGIEGISVHLHVLNIDQQIIEHRKAGRWTAVQSWYELQLAEKPNDVETQVNLLSCLKESGQHDALLTRIEGMHQSPFAMSKALPFAMEAAWVTGKWSMLQQYVDMSSGVLDHAFEVGVGHALLALHQQQQDKFGKIITELGAHVATGLSRSTTASLQACHDDLLKLQVITEIGMISGASGQHVERRDVIDDLDRRLDLLGSFLSDKQYLLGVRRAAMELSGLTFTKQDLASAWLTSARLARKGNFTHLSFNAVMHASNLGAGSATIEHSRLLWKEGYHRKATQSLEGAISANVFRSQAPQPLKGSAPDNTAGSDQEQNLLFAQAHLLLAKWLDSAGQTPSYSVIQKYQKATAAYKKWEKGNYYLGRHYSKLFESEKLLPANKQSSPFLSGETARLVIHNYLKSLTFGAKYIFQTLPRILTLWLDLGFEVSNAVEAKHSANGAQRKKLLESRKAQLTRVHVHLKGYMDKLPAFVFYTALSQIVARICHPNNEVFAILKQIIVKVVSTHPQQALWTLLAVVKSSSKDRASRGMQCLSNIKGDRGALSGGDVKKLISQGQRLSDQLLGVCEIEVRGKVTSVSLERDLAFNHKTVSCPLVVPVEKSLSASLPLVANTVRSHKAFPKDAITISNFLDDVLVLSSLQRPRKISVRGSDGNVYGLLCKPKDDLRKDQRLMEFNAMINRSLKRDAETSKRRLYIKTYAVTPLNEECGLIEWVDNLKTLREILLKLYKAKAIQPNYTEIRGILDDVCADSTKMNLFTERILRSFPPVFHEWFVEMFPEPGAWFNARLKYTRSCAVMSMVGMVLGLGDRHGENILFEEGNGGTFHVDFNCLFDKGLMFEKPEKVPFRLTQNMVDAFGVYGYEGPFRKSCELTSMILRQNEDTLLTILETFLYDPTTDFLGKKKRATANVPETPQEVLDSVRSKVRGLLPGESVPLSVEGHVEELIQQATSAENLSAMYIGWCAFF
ncbi:MAG: hypothetical protein M1825_000866 [Sarcosagium campestre]|nr:MAG: hypothetical protein M1825_000866 [Sarcosagium campestre]